MKHTLVKFRERLLTLTVARPGCPLCEAARDIALPIGESLTADVVYPDGRREPPRRVTCTKGADGKPVYHCEVVQ